MRLISFLGTGNYGETTYSFEGKTQRTRYVASALSSFTRPCDIRLIATTEAWEQHGKELKETLISIGLTDVEQVWIPTTGEPENLWAIFGKIVELIRAPQGEILFDVTHGFRAHPFFASSCIQYVQSVFPNAPSIRVVYGEYRKDEDISPIWELTPFLEVLSWSRNLMMFLRTGQADEIVKATEQLGKSLNKQLADEGTKSGFSQLPKLAKALKAFSNDFTTIRTGSLLNGQDASANGLFNAIDRTKQEVAQHLPALANILDQVRAMVEPLRTGDARLSSKEGQQGLIALARLYQKMGRYSEAISILREGWITLGAKPDADHPGPCFRRESRENQELTWQSTTPQSRSVSELRNDIQHAGFNQQPHERSWFEEQLNILLNQWQAAIDSMGQDHPE